MAIATSRLSSGLSGCCIIYNLYTINIETSAIDTITEITVHRLIGDKMKGLVTNLYGKNIVIYILKKFC